MVVRERNIPTSSRTKNKHHIFHCKDLHSKLLVQYIEGFRPQYVYKRRNSVLDQNPQSLTFLKSSPATCYQALDRDGYAFGNECMLRHLLIGRPMTLCPRLNIELIDRE